MVSSRDVEPKGQASNVDGRQERSDVFGVTRRDPAPAFQFQKGVLDQMALTINVFVVFALDDAVLFRRDDSFHARRPRLLNDRIRIVTTIGQ
jgi:hypothetical protein